MIKQQSGYISVTEIVDNFVKNRGATLRKPAPMRACDRSMTFKAVKNSMKSYACNVSPCFCEPSGRAACHLRDSGFLWSTRQPVRVAGVLPGVAC